jgi:predicted ATP-grasp superfamily ATP-dependent carboligase
MGRHQKELLERFRFRLPPPAILEALNDKRLETEMIASLGIPIPKTIAHPPPDPESLEEQLRYPIIFKPHVFSVQHVFPLKNAIVRNREELQTFYEKWPDGISILLAQEVIPGPDSASWICSCTYDETHRLLDCGIKQKLRALPAHFGGSTFAVSKSNPEILELARVLGQKLEYVGHAGIEFRWDHRDRQYKYIEWNPRIPANVGFDEACGLPTVWNSYRVAAHGRAEPRGRAQRDGVYYLDFKGDFFSQRADGASRGRALLALFSTLVTRRTNGPYFAWDDPAPGIVVARQFLSNIFRSAGAKPSGRQGLAPEQT